jgi:hypothetical protein
LKVSDYEVAISIPARRKASVNERQYYQKYENLNEIAKKSTLSIGNINSFV